MFQLFYPFVNFLLYKPDTCMYFKSKQRIKVITHIYNTYKAVRRIQQLSVMKCPLWYMNRWNTVSMKYHSEKEKYKTKIKTDSKEPG